MRIMAHFRDRRTCLSMAAGLAAARYGRVLHWPKAGKWCSTYTRPVTGLKDAGGRCGDVEKSIRQEAAPQRSLQQQPVPDGRGDEVLLQGHAAHPPVRGKIRPALRHGPDRRFLPP